MVRLTDTPLQQADDTVMTDRAARLTDEEFEQRVQGLAWDAMSDSGISKSIRVLKAHNAAILASERDALERVDHLRAHILDIDAHATPYGDIPDEKVAEWDSAAREHQFGQTETSVIRALIADRAAILDSERDLLAALETFVADERLRRARYDEDLDEGSPEAKAIALIARSRGQDALGGSEPSKMTS
jgi:hypothetical protein